MTKNGLFVCLFWMALAWSSQQALKAAAGAPGWRPQKGWGNERLQGPAWFGFLPLPLSCPGHDRYVKARRALRSLFSTPLACVCSSAMFYFFIFCISPLPVPPPPSFSIPGAVRWQTIDIHASLSPSGISVSAALFSQVLHWPCRELRQLQSGPLCCHTGRDVPFQARSYCCSSSCEVTGWGTGP